MPDARFPRSVKPHAARSGVQAVDRALRLLHVLSLHGRQGMALGDLARRSELDAATARRLLISLIQGGFATQEPSSRRYFLGLDFFSVAAAAANRFDLGEARRGALVRLSRRLSLTAAYFQRDGDDVVCVDAVHAAAPAPATDIGARRPIGSETFGLAVLASLPDEEGEAVMIRNVRRFSRAPEDAIRHVGARMRDTRRDGYVVDADAAWRRWSVAVAIRDRDGRPAGALGLAAPLGEAPPGLSATLDPLRNEALVFQDHLWRVPAGTLNGDARPSVAARALPDFMM